MNLDYSGVVFVDGKWMIKELCHHAKSALLGVLDINSATCIRESDRDDYLNNPIDRMMLEIPVSYNSVAYKGLPQIEIGSFPFVIPNEAYDYEKGLIIELAQNRIFKTQKL
jgi:CRISPR-associated endonuclease/helicase Cas3